MKAKWVLRCTTAGSGGTAEPTWPTTNNGTVTCSGGVGPFAVFTNVTGQSTYNWNAAAGDIPTLVGAVGTFRFTAGDVMYVSSDHNETQTASSSFGTGSAGASYTGGQVLSVNRAGSVPPVGADLLAGASVTVGTGVVGLTMEAGFPLYHYGMNYIETGSAGGGIVINGSSTKSHLFDTCQLYLNNSTANQRITSSVLASFTFYNTTLRFGAVSQGIAASVTQEITWLNTPSALAGATFPTLLFNASSGTQSQITVRGVDLSALTGTLVGNSVSLGTKALFDSCKIAAAVTRYSLTSPAAITNTRDLVEFVNCYDGSNFIAESYQPTGTLTTEFTITLVGGATDNVGTFSHKMVSGTNIDKYVNTLNSFWLDVNNTATGSPLTATVEIVSSGSLNNDEISMLLEYEGTASSSVASFVSTLPTNVLTPSAAVTSSSATWNSNPATPSFQKLTAIFTPQTAGRVRALIKLGKASTTVYINPQITLT